jgi:cob(I)alamin adenosyltransferase
VDKDDLRVEAYGTVDEVNSFVGKAMTELDADRFDDILNELENIQHELFDCGGDLANKAHKRPYKLQEEAIDHLEQRIDHYIESTPALERFILSGGTKAAATIHIARTVTRRAERTVVSLMKRDESVAPLAARYLNRLSDYFFALAREINHRSGVKDVEYVRSANVFRGGKRIDKEQGHD